MARKASAASIMTFEGKNKSSWELFGANDGRKATPSSTRPTVMNLSTLADRVQDAKP